jgi:hypothetical protein
MGGYSEMIATTTMIALPAPGFANVGNWVRFDGRVRNGLVRPRAAT